jgi:hypothetical protein
MKRSVRLEFLAQRKFALTILGVSILVVVGGAISTQLSSNAQAAYASTAQQGRDEVRVELNGNGFTPGEVQHAPGSFAILVDNKTISGEYTLNLKADDGTVVSELQVQKGSSAWTVSLQTGRYTLTEINHSQWVCSIVVQ